MIRMVVHYRLGTTNKVACGNYAAIQWSSLRSEVTCKKCLASIHMAKGGK